MAILAARGLGIDVRRERQSGVDDLRPGLMTGPCDPVDLEPPVADVGVADEPPGRVRYGTSIVNPAPSSAKVCWPVALMGGTVPVVKDSGRAPRACPPPRSRCPDAGAGGVRGHRRRDRARGAVRARRPPRRAARGVRPGRAVRADGRRRALRRAHRRAARALGRRRPGRDRAGAEDLDRGLYEYHLDFPGDALDPELRLRALGPARHRGRGPAVYAHVATDPGYPGQLALQYWIFYAFNDWNNLHEGDWEMIQLVFDATTRPRRSRSSRRRSATASTRAPNGPTGATATSSRSSTARIRSCTRPPARTRTTSTRALFLGSSASQGVGCDDTSGPTRDLRPVVHTIPSDPAEAREAFPWIEFEGRWGELQPAFYNGPTGPNLKRQWTEPIAWSEDWRDRSYAVPAGGAARHGRDRLLLRRDRGGSALLRRSITTRCPRSS